MRSAGKLQPWEVDMMVSAFGIALALVLAAWTARLWTLANRAEHVVVLRLERGTFLLARQPDGRFLLIHPANVPAALARFEARRTVDRWHALRAAVARPFAWKRAAAQLH
jgi:hypothetical protein